MRLSITLVSKFAGQFFSTFYISKIHEISEFLFMLIYSYTSPSKHAI